MRNILSLSILVLAVMLAGMSASVQAQCVPDSTINASSGVFPAVPAEACAGQPYSQVLTVVIPPDTTITNPFPLTVPIDSVTIDNVVGLPPGLTYQCVPASCGFPGGTSGCILVSGTVTVPDTYDISIVATFYSLLTLTDTLDADIQFIVKPGVTATVAPFDANCGQSDGSAIVAAAGSAMPFTYSWSTGATGTDSIGGLSAGVYSVTVEDTSGCSETVNFTIGNVGNVPVLSTVDQGWEGCAEDDGGYILLGAVSGGTSPYTYSWSNGSVNDSVDGLAPGPYLLTVTDASGCITQEDFMVEAPDTLVVELVNLENVVCYGDENGLVEVMADGGAGTLAYSWMPGETTNSIDNLGPGDYTVTVTDEFGCEKMMTYTVTEPDSLSAILTSMDESTPGAGDGTATADVSGGTPPYTYGWSNGSDSASAVNLTPGTYIFEVEDANGCTLVDSVIIIDRTSIEEDLGFQSFSLSPNPHSGLFQIEWQQQGSHNVDIVILDLRGRIQWQQQVQSHGSYRSQIDISHLPAGIYLLQLKSEGRSSGVKMIKY